MAGAVIRAVALDDADELLALRLANRDFLQPSEPDRPASFYTAGGHREAIEGLLERRRRGTGFGFVIVDDGAVAGQITISNVVRGALMSANVGYWVDRSRNGRGLATRAVGDVVETAFGDLGLHRLEAGTLLDNVASQRVLEKNAFERIGIARRYLCIGGAWRDHVLFQRTAES